MTSYSDKDDDQRIENGLKKKALEEKYGAHFSQHSDLPPEMESDWLKHIELFEQQYAQQKTTTVFDYLEQPSYLQLSELNDAQISEELHRILTLMNEGGISLSALCEVDDKELYRFIIDELFVYEMDDMKIPGMMSCFTYEEFHPNAKWDINQAIDYFFSFTMGKHENIGGDGYDLLYIDSKNFISHKGEAIPEERLIKTINNFLKSFDSFEIIKKEMEALELNEEMTDATAYLNMEFKAIYNSGKEWMDYKGEAIFKLHPGNYGGWEIYAMDFPGLEL
ncbi:hypothetical protein HNS38_10225 [Lentimicrobium sp. L6]|uniref:hypothetical protein n=1 Tax=Lentimicrobium sp. L6 TaxID=2735916 RepID=UPI001555BCB3|nr:hypothetical protein [Lentimicrobium sp. L6]NPD85137.1 hypothetical protein [Lentimicrobium sp. L6]